jgi:hypothetical protein
MTKRLSKGKLQGWPKTNEVINPMAAKHLRQLLTGDHIDPSWQKIT